MIQITHEQFEHIPALVVEQTGTTEEAKPVVVFLHGFQSAKEHNLHYAYQLAMQGIRIVLPDALLHGERSEHATFERLSANFWKIVLTSIHELAIIYEALRPRIVAGGFGVGGTSMGAITTYGILATYDEVDVAVSMMGNAQYETLARGQMNYIERKGLTLPIGAEEIEALFRKLRRVDLSRQVERLHQRPLYIWHGEQDSIVPFELASQFVKQIEPHYEKGRLRFVADEEAGHAVPRYAMLESTKWFTTHLAKADELRK